MNCLFVFLLFLVTFADDSVVLTKEEVNSLVESGNAASFQGLLCGFY